MVRRLSEVEGSSCPLCGRPWAVQVRELKAAIAAPAVHRLEQDHPGWQAADGACPSCVHAAAQAVCAGRSAESIQNELLLPYPVYSAEETRLIPARELVNAIPGYSGAGVVMAFLDSGFYPHPDLMQPANRIVAMVDATSAQPQEEARFTRPQVSSWHGLMTACVGAGNGRLSDGVFCGIAPEARVALVKTGNPEARGIREADIQRALTWVLANQQRFNIRIVNISLGGDFPTHGKLNELELLVEEAVRRNIIVVAAAGNEGAERLLPPASAPSAITVGGLDLRNSFEQRRWQLYPSNYGKVPGVRPKPELVAPARWLAAPMLPNTRQHTESQFLWQVEKSAGAPAPERNGKTPSREAERKRHFESVRRTVRSRMIAQKYIHPHYQHVDGTSMAAPVVSGVAAQMLEANPGLSAGMVREILIATATPLETFPAEKRGAGLVNAGRAVAAARRAGRGVLTSLPLSPYIHEGRVNFYYFDPLNRAECVALVSSLNGWNPQGQALETHSPGLWQLSIPVPPPGIYVYKFLVDDRWVHDPENVVWVEDGYGGFSSILEVRR